MALYHFHADLIRRSAGQSVVAAAAYRAGEKLHCDYYGNDADYTKKGGVICSEILLPSHTPPEYVDRETLWNAVEKVENYEKRVNVLYRLNGRDYFRVKEIEANYEKVRAMLDERYGQFLGDTPPEEQETEKE